MSTAGRSVGLLKPALTATKLCVVGGVVYSGRGWMRVWRTVGGCVALAASLLVVAAAGAANGRASSHAVCPAALVGFARCHSQVVTDARGNPQATASPTGYGPVQFQTAYSLPSST